MTREEFDFDRSVEAAWVRFAGRLAEVLSMMDETEPLTLVPCEPDDGLWYIRFECSSTDMITAFVPDHYGADPFTDDQIAHIAALRFVRVDDVFERSIDQGDCLDLAKDATEVLAEIFMVEHPIFLDSDVLAEVLQEGESLPPDTDPSDLEVFMPLDEVELQGQVEAELVHRFDAIPMRDQDGDFAVRIGSTMLFIRVSPDAKEVRLFSVIVHDIAGRSRAAEVLNDINAHSRWVRFYLMRDKIIATLPLSTRPFVPAHFRLAVDEMTKVADGVDDLLASSLSGRTTFSD